MDNAGGSQIARPVTDRIQSLLLSILAMNLGHYFPKGSEIIVTIVIRKQISAAGGNWRRTA
jgi:hypothetical protein